MSNRVTAGFPANEQKRRGGTLLLAAGLMAFASTAPAVERVLDDFSFATAFSIASGGTPVGTTQVANDASIPGGTRETTAFSLDAPTEGGETKIGVGQTSVGRANHSQDSADTNGYSTIVYPSLNEDFSAVTKIIMGIFFQDLAAQVTFDLCTNADCISQTQTVGPVAVPSDPAVPVDFLIGGFSGSPGFDISNVTSMEIQINTSVLPNQGALDMDIEYIAVDETLPNCQCDDLRLNDDDTLDIILSVGGDPGAADCTFGPVNVALGCTGLSLEVTGPATPGDCTLAPDPATGDFTVTCTAARSVGSTLNIGLNYAVTGEAGDCSVAVQGPLTCTPNVPGAPPVQCNVNTAACSDTISREIPPPPPIPGISALGLAASLIILPLAGGMFARRRRRL